MTLVVADHSRAGYNAAVFESFLAARREPQWMTDARRQSFSVYQQLLSQELDAEEFRRLDLRTFNASRFRPATSAPDAGGIATLLSGRTEFGGAITHVDGHVTSSRVSPEIAAQGVLFGGLQELLESHRELLEPYFMKRAVHADADRFAAWHAAFWTSGTVLYVPRNVEVSLPLHSLIAHSQDGTADFSHTLIILEDGARATLLEETASAGPEIAGLHVGCVELIVGRNACLRYVQLQNWNQKTWHLAHQAGCVDANATLQWTVVGLGSRTAHIHQDINLDGRGSTAEVNGVTFAS
ncbi:MAG: SufD family Fe-S cluster assembly protein, partial [Planctomyces sp.]